MPHTTMHKTGPPYTTIATPTTDDPSTPTIPQWLCVLDRATPLLAPADADVIVLADIRVRDVHDW